jgi:uncharacterized protein YndB with AHSA1/START domain
MSGGAVVRFRHEYRFGVTPERLWETLGRFDLYPTWWAWLRDFAATPSNAGLAVGTELRGTVVPPLPGRLSVRVVLNTCRPRELIEATVHGDVRGEASLHFAPLPEGTTVTADWTLRMAKSPLRLATLLAPPVARWAHDQVVAMAVAGFRRHALSAVPG